jgi:uridylate kinase
MANSPWTVVSLGGSVIVPNEIDIEYLKNFAALIRKHIARGQKFIIIAGGGKTCRKYQDAARALGELSKNDLDWLGIHTTRLNGHLLRSVFRAEAHPALIKDPTESVPSADIIIAAGWEPGWSTDYVAVKLAKNVGAERLVNVSNVDYVYTADPKTDVNAQKVEKIGWKEFRNLLPAEWDPGMNAPFDPVAAEEAEAAQLEVAFMGPSIQEFDNYLNFTPFKGTLISG